MTDALDDFVVEKAAGYRGLARAVLDVGNQWKADRDLRLSIHNTHGTISTWRFTTDFDHVITFDQYGPDAPGNPIVVLPDYTGSLNDALALFQGGCTQHLRPIMRQYEDGQWCVRFDFGQPMLNAPRVYGYDLTSTVLICGLLSAAFLVDGGEGHIG